MLKSQVNKLLGSSLLRFAITGVLNTIVGLGTIYALKWFWNMDDTPANAIGYVVGVLFSLVVNSRWTFQSRESLFNIAPRYLTVVLIAYFTNLGCVHLLIRSAHVNSYLAQALGTIPYTTITYLASRWWIFRRSGIDADAK